MLVNIPAFTICARCRPKLAQLLKNSTKIYLSDGEDIWGSNTIERWRTRVNCPQVDRQINDIDKIKEAHYSIVVACIHNDDELGPKSPYYILGHLNHEYVLISNDARREFLRKYRPDIE